MWLSLFAPSCRGNLLARDVTNLVPPEAMVETEYLTTLLVVVPRYALLALASPRPCLWSNSFFRTEVKSWYGNYETLAPYVVPRSSQYASAFANRFCGSASLTQAFLLESCIQIPITPSSKLRCLRRPLRSSRTTLANTSAFSTPESIFHFDSLSIAKQFSNLHRISSLASQIFLSPGSRTVDRSAAGARVCLAFGYLFKIKWYPKTISSVVKHCGCEIVSMTASVVTMSHIFVHPFFLFCFLWHNLSLFFFPNKPWSYPPHFFHQVYSQKVWA